MVDEYGNIKICCCFDEVLAQPANILCKISTTLSRLTATFHMTPIMTFAQVVETSVTITDNSPFKVESDLASLIYDTRTDLHQKKLKHSRQTTETVKTC